MKYLINNSEHNEGLWTFENHKSILLKWDLLPFNINTGAIDTVAASHWRSYDISLLIRNCWNELKQDLDDKVRVTAGIQDIFFLDQSVKILETEMKKLNSKFEFVY